MSEVYGAKEPLPPTNIKDVLLPAIAKDFTARYIELDIGDRSFLAHVLNLLHTPTSQLSTDDFSFLRNLNETGEAAWRNQHQIDEMDDDEFGRWRSTNPEAAEEFEQILIFRQWLECEPNAQGIIELDEGRRAIWQAFAKKPFESLDEEEKALFQSLSFRGIPSELLEADTPYEQVLRLDWRALQITCFSIRRSGIERPRETYIFLPEFLQLQYPRHIAIIGLDLNRILRIYTTAAAEIDNLYGEGEDDPATSRLRTVLRERQQAYSAYAKQKYAQHEWEQRLYEDSYSHPSFL